jgi:hypothetical protein
MLKTLLALPSLLKQELAYTNKEKLPGSRLTEGRFAANANGTIVSAMRLLLRRFR